MEEPLKRAQPQGRGDVIFKSAIADVTAGRERICHWNSLLQPLVARCPIRRMP